MKFFVISFLSTALFLFGCKNSTKHNNSLTPYYYIDLENNLDKIQSVPLSTLGSKLEYIPLETNPDCLINSIYKVSVTDSFIVVCDSKQGLFLFTIEGKYLRKIGKIGRGPDEYPDVNDFVIDNDQKEIFILSTRKVCVYDFNGQFKRDFKLDFPCEQIIMDKNDNLIIHLYNSAQPTTNPVYSWHIFDKSGILRQKIENPLKRVNRGPTFPFSPLYIYNGTPHIMEFGIDTLYNYSGNKKNPYAVFNFGKMKFPVDLTFSESGNIKNWIWISHIRETKDLLLMNVWKGSRTIMKCVYNKTTTDLVVIGENGFTNDIDYGFNFWPQMRTNDNPLVDYIPVKYIINYSKNNQEKDNKQSNRIKELASQLSETSNPVVVILRN
jgi:hypothetical protein